MRKKCYKIYTSFTEGISNYNLLEHLFLHARLPVIKVLLNLRHTNYVHFVYLLMKNFNFSIQIYVAVYKT
jgi:hypothetical protein